MVGILEGSKSQCPRLGNTVGRIVAGALILMSCSPVFAQLKESDIDTLLTTALTETQNIPANACVSMPNPGVKLPGNTETASLMYPSGDIRKDVAALIDAGLITVKFNSGEGASALAVFKAKAAGTDSSTSPNVALSYVELTPLGNKFYRYDDPKSGHLPQGLYGANRFCAHIQYGGVEKYMKPLKNPYDDNPHLVSWVNFKWKLDQHKTPWLNNAVLKEQLSIYSDKDSWSRSGILIELNDDKWELGKEPYTIRW